MTTVAVPFRQFAVTPAVIGILMVVISTVAFAIVPSFARLAYDGGSNPLTLITVRSIVTACVGLLILLPTGDGGHEPVPPCGPA